MENVLFDVIDGVATLTLNRPDKYNAIVKDMALKMQEYLDRCKEDEEIRSVYLTGAGKAFCAGQDLKEAIGENGIELHSIVEHHYNPLILRIWELEKPVVAAVNGVAAGAGANIALSTDIVVAKQSAKFIQAFSSIGLIPDSGGTFTLPRLVGMQKATALCMLGEPIDATEAERIGMIYKVLPDENFEQQSFDLALRLSRMPTRGLGLTKRAIRMSFRNDIDKQLAIECELQTAAGQTHDYTEGVNAFLEKRKPEFKGK